MATQPGPSNSNGQGGVPSSRDPELDLEAQQGVEIISMVPRPGDDNNPQQPVVKTIPKVREELRRAAGEHFFAPQAVMIGPYHQRRREQGSDSSSFSSTEKNKAVRNLEKGRCDLAALEKLLLDDELRDQVRRYYTHLPDEEYMGHKAFAEMLLHDGCYLLSFFTKLVPQGGTTLDILTKNNTIVRDTLYLLENQIPLLVLDRMLRHIVVEEDSALSCIAEPVEELMQRQLYISKTRRPLPPESTTSDLLHLVHSYFRPSPPTEPSGLLHLVRSCFRTLLQLVCSYIQATPEAARQLPTEPAPEAAERQLPSDLTGRWRRATDYSRYANLRFRRRAFETGQDWTILDIQLQGGTLHIPFLRVGSSTWTMLRNLMALEEQEEERRPVTAYCFFMSQVACTAEDVDLLQRAKILEHFLGSDEQAAKGFAQLCDGMALDIDKDERNYLKPIWHCLDQRCSSKVHTIMGFFRQEYWGNVYYRLVFFVAVITTICQVAQTILAFFGYLKPPHQAPRP